MKESLHIIPEIHPNSKWSKINDDEYYLYNESFNTHMLISSSAFSVIECINGKNTIKDITDLLTDNDSEEEDYQNIISFICLDLKKQNIIVSDDKGVPRKSYIKFSKIILKGSLINPICNGLTFLFKPLVVISFVTAISLFILYLLFSKDIVNNENNTNPFIMLLGSAFLLLFHELGHCTALRYRKLESKGIGIGIHFLFPVLFAEVTPAWKLQPRKRIAVDLGGFYFQGVVTLIYFIIAICFNNSSFISLVYFSVMLFVFNLNPFFKSDIYWSISDYFNIPNLHEAANDMLISSFKKKSLPRNNIFLIIFGLARYLFLGFIIYLVFSLFYRFLNNIINGEYHTTFWNIQRDALITIALVFFLSKTKNVLNYLFIKRLDKR